MELSLHPLIFFDYLSLSAGLQGTQLLSVLPWYDVLVRKLFVGTWSAHDRFLSLILWTFSTTSKNQGYILYNNIYIHLSQRSYFIIWICFDNNFVSPTVVVLNVYNFQWQLYKTIRLTVCPFGSMFFNSPSVPLSPILPLFLSFSIHLLFVYPF